MKLLFIDVETTGVMHWRNGIHQISGIVEIDGEVKEEFDFRVRPNPKCTIEAQALTVGNVTESQILEYPPMEKVYKELSDILSKYVDKFKKTDKFFFVAYNAHFDNAFVRAFFKQNGDDYFGSWFWSNSIDVMVLASDKLKDKRAEMVNFKLMTVAKSLGIDIDESKLHDSMYDIQLTRDIYKLI